MVTFRGERALGAIFDRAIEAIFLVDDEGRFLRVNPAAQKLTGHSAEELEKMTFFDLTPTVKREEGRSMWRDLLRGGALAGDYTLARKDGSLVEVEFQAVANIMPGTHLSIVRDATARNRDERQLRRAAKLQEATAAMSAAVDTAQVGEVILHAGLAALEALGGYVVAVVDRGRWAEVVAAAGMAPDHEARWAEDFRALGFPPKRVDGRLRFSLEAPTLLVDAFERGGPARVEQVADMPPSRAKSRLAGLGDATVCLPLVARGALVGGLFLFWKEKRAFNDDESTFVATLAALCAQALDRARLFTAEREARERAVTSEWSAREYQQKLQRMAFDRVVVEERERRRLACALHDGVTQYLALAKLTLAPVRQEVEGAGRTAFDAAMKLLTDAIAETHSLSFELSPPMLYDLGISAALSWLAEKLAQTTGLRVEIADDGKGASLDDVTASIVFRTVRELLMNVVKHARAATAKVSIRHAPEGLDFVVEDAGAGFEPAETAAQAGFGLMSVREQIGRLGGSVEVTSAPNEGTRIKVHVPSQPYSDI